VTQQFKAAGQQIYEAGNPIVLVVTMDADEPEAGDWHVPYLAPVVAQPGKGIVTKLLWRGAPEQAAA
jgi:hypothetical protein